MINNNGEKWIVVSPDEEVRSALKRYLEFVKNVNKNDKSNIEEKSLDEFIKFLATEPEKFKHKKFLIYLCPFDRKKESVMNYKSGLLHDPFEYPISDLLATVIFGKEFYEKNQGNSGGKKNWFLNNAVFVGYVEIEQNQEENSGNIKINYWSVIKKSNFGEPSEIFISREKLASQMQKALEKEAFIPHGEV